MDWFLKYGIMNHVCRCIMDPYTFPIYRVEVYGKRMNLYMENATRELRVFRSNELLYEAGTELAAYKVDESDKQNVYQSMIDFVFDAAKIV